MRLDDEFRPLDLHGYLTEVGHLGDDVVDGEVETAGGVDAEGEVREVWEGEDGW